MDRNFRKPFAEGSEGSPPIDAWSFAQAILGKPIPSPSRAEDDAWAEREQLEWLAKISPRHELELRSLQSAEAEARHERELLEWLAKISTEHEAKLRCLLREEAEARAAQQRYERFADSYAQEWAADKHPRAGVPPNPGWWASTSGSGSAPTPGSGSVRTVSYRADQATARLASFSTGAASAWPTTGPASSWLPKVGSGAGAGAGAAAGIGAGGFLGGLRNASMGAYWARVPGVRTMPQIWVYELEKRVRAGKLSREDAIAIFNTVVLGAEAQGFKPSGGTMSAVHNSAVDFLGKAEAIYFARKKEAREAEGAQAKPERVTGESLAKLRREFDAMKSKLWTKEAEDSPDKYTPEQLASIRQGKTPKDSNGKPLEIHHKKPLSEGGTNTHDNFQFGTREDHRIGPNFKKNHPNLPRGRAQ